MQLSCNVWLQHKNVYHDVCVERTVEGENPKVPRFGLSLRFVLKLSVLPGLGVDPMNTEKRCVVLKDNLPLRSPCCFPTLVVVCGVLLSSPFPRHKAGVLTPITNAKSSGIPSTYKLQPPSQLQFGENFFPMWKKCTCSPVRFAFSNARHSNTVPLCKRV